MALYDNQTLYNTLLELDIAPEKALKSALKESTRDKRPLHKVLIEQEVVSKEHLGKVISDLSKIPFIELSKQSIPDEVLNLIPEVVAKKQRVVAFNRDERGLHLAMADPTNLEALELAKKRVGETVIPYYANEEDVDTALFLYAKNVVVAFDDIISREVEEAKSAKEAEKKTPLIIKIVDTIISYAYKNKASDIHIEPQDDVSMVRFRIDGVLHDIVKLPLELHPQIVTRIKVMASLRTDEHHAAQDGKIQQQLEWENLDIRVSTVPISDGEKIVMRLLSVRSRQFSLLDLGFGEDDLTKMKSAYSKPYGMILSTGPTGSGKTTTMYAILKILNSRDVNVMTIEDPVEYDIEGVNQIQVNPRTELTFAKGLRAIVRQDPDIILVGEIRDHETAGIAVNSAMTGHLVLSTLHTNDAPTAVPRLLDLGVEPFLVASSVNVIVAQRLVRKICPSCKTSKEVEISKVGINVELLKKHLGNKKSITVYYGKGCPVCHKSGYWGRVGIYEVLLVDDEMKEAIVARHDASKIGELAKSKGMTTMIEDGIRKLGEGVTTVEEILRVTKE